MNESEVAFERVLGNLLEVGRRRGVVIQAMWVRVDGASPPAGEVEAWLGRLGELLAGGARIKKVQVYTVARRPRASRVGPLGREELEAMAGRVRELGVEAVAYA
jgi:hypothetical protein